MKRHFILFSAVLIIGVFTAIALTTQPKATMAKPANAGTAVATAAATDEATDNPCASVRPASTAAATTVAQATAVGTEAAQQIPRPSNAGGPGPALQLVGDAKAGAKIFADNCVKCHGDQGAKGVDNPGSDDGTVPVLNPIDPLITDPDLKVFACNIDLFVEHGSTPSGDNPTQKMTAWGDESKLTPQQIADVIAYVISLNPPAAATPTQ